MLFTLTPQAMPAGYGEALLSLADAKAHLGVLSSDFDALIEALRDAAIDMVEKYTSLYLAPREGLVATFAGFACERPMRIWRGPDATVVVTGVSYVDGDGASVAIADGGWRIDPAGGLMPVTGASWPVSYGPVTVTFSAGFPDGACPPTLIAAAKLFMGHLFVNREAVVANGASGELSLGFRTLCDMHRMPVI